MELLGLIPDLIGTAIGAIGSLVQSGDDGPSKVHMEATIAKAQRMRLAHALEQRSRPDAVSWGIAIAGVGLLVYTLGGKD